MLHRCVNVQYLGYTILILPSRQLYEYIRSYRALNVREYLVTYMYSMYILY